MAPRQDPMARFDHIPDLPRNSDQITDKDPVLLVGQYGGAQDVFGDFHFGGERDVSAVYDD